MNNLEKYIGREVYIKEGSWMAGAWGIVVAIIGDEWHIAIYGDTDSCPVYSRDELRIPRKQR